MNNLIKNIEVAYEKIKAPGFLKKEGLGGEIPFFIFTYNIKDENRIDTEIEGLMKRLTKEGVRIVNLNLYDVVIQILQEKGGMEAMFQLEKKKKDKPSYFIKALSSALNMHEVLIPFIEKKVQEIPNDVVFITGVAAVYPFIRSHSILNNLQSKIGHSSLVLFFPGVYDDKSLKLFDRLPAENYYRAFNIKNFKN